MKLDVGKLEFLLAQLYTYWKQHPNKGKYNTDVIRNGLQVSKRALTMEEKINLTPYTANILKQLSHGKVESLHAEDPETVLDKYLESKTRSLLIKYCGQPSDKYPEDPLSYQNYCVDC